jgi:sugar phosphate permease
MAGSAILGAMPVTLTIIPAESIPRAYVAQTIGLVVGIAELAGGFIAPATAGLAADTYGLSAVFYIAAGAALAASIASFLLVETAPVRANKK